ncbi:MAG: DUF4861 domain-containing protein [Prevotella sp.]|jgi:hypothetical protein
MFKKNCLLIMGLFCSVSAMKAQTSLSVQLSSEVKQNSAPVVIDLKPYGDVRAANVVIDGREIVSQLDDLNGDGINDELAFLVDMNRKSTKKAIVKLLYDEQQKNYPSRTYAEIVLRNPKIKEKNRHDIYLNSISIDSETKNPYNVLHHHGVAFENELIAMRIYMDKRQTIDLYGKFHKGLELKDTQFYTSKEQKQQGYGDDVLWVGNSFGLGAFRGWDGKQPSMIENVKSRKQHILSQGPVRTIVEVEDCGWSIMPGERPVSMTLRYTLYAGRRDFQVNVLFNRDVSNHTFSTGIINVKGSKELTNHKGLRGCWGTDWPAADTLNWKRETVGLGILLPKGSSFTEIPANKDNYAFTLKMNREYTYWLTYTSANEEFGYHSADEWFDYLKHWEKEMENPVRIEKMSTTPALIQQPK